MQWQIRPKSLAVVAAFCFLAVTEALRFRRRKTKKTVYGLQHGRLHLDAHVPMWMNMGYWKVDGKDALNPKSLAEACRDLLELVLSEAGLSEDSKQDHSRCLIDVGFGCGEQTIYLMNEKPVSRCDELWWSARDHQVYFDQYIGITQDGAQCGYAQERVNELKKDSISLFCADASKPRIWSEQLLATIKAAKSKSKETWLLALDTAYHFSPSRWGIVEHAYHRLDASFMAFDLCLSPNARPLQKLILRILTTLMGAPWVNFITPEAYRQRLMNIGYPADAIKIVDISEHVFAPLATYMEEQDRRLKILGLGLGSFHAAKWLFRWWGRTGVVKGVVVVARHKECSQ
ncbi:hypothetical protein BU25DRAFT_389874 [Macroventuria anomochaeta]|uniref:Uncharacterized protein n=1 Tax=Macroventuria anomochaeta TaxID=301207 RepID=A0ACB6S6B7_9PLEO|nr:uncharacterized protein BU25DRAFT_389874 [Macroventuria anomochaeta]KAF2628934.1 hypothetical protein BU25DRAFT_389874 [Macroventuria anomochaeta]